MQPFWRGFFDIFWVRSLFRTMEDARTSRNIEYSWSWQGLATFLILAIIFDRLTIRLSFNFAEDWRTADIAVLVSYVFLAIRGWILWKAQKLANLICDDPMGSSNTKLVWWQIVFMVVLVVLSIFGTFQAVAELSAGEPWPQ